MGGNYTRDEQREFTCSAVQYGGQKYGLFCPPVSFVMSKFQKAQAELGEGIVSLCKPTKDKEFCGGF